MFCFPYAGGSSFIYSKWESKLSNNIKLISVDPSGHGSRIKERLCSSIEEMVEDYYCQIKDLIPQRKFAFFGHSMGAIAAHELSHKFREKNNIEPDYLFISGYQAPSTYSKIEKIYDLPMKEFKEKLFSYGGTPKEILQNEELMEIFLPILRKDFELCFNYKYKHNSPLQCNIVGLFGEDEGSSEEQIKRWENYTTADYTYILYPGDHFFMNQNMNEIIEVINRKLK